MEIDLKNDQCVVQIGEMDRLHSSTANDCDVVITDNQA